LDPLLCLKSKWLNIYVANWIWAGGGATRNIFRKIYDKNFVEIASKPKIQINPGDNTYSVQAKIISFINENHLIFW